MPCQSLDALAVKTHEAIYYGTASTQSQSTHANLPSLCIIDRVVLPSVRQSTYAMDPELSGDCCCILWICFLLCALTGGREGGGGVKGGEGEGRRAERMGGEGRGVSSKG